MISMNVVASNDVVAMPKIDMIIVITVNPQTNFPVRVNVISSVTNGSSGLKLVNQSINPVYSVIYLFAI